MAVSFLRIVRITKVGRVLNRADTDIFNQNPYFLTFNVCFNSILYSEPTFVILTILKEVIAV